jgi:soluble lytic murein transglycosylase-like protein
MLEDFDKLIVSLATGYALDPAIVRAMVSIESSGDTFAYNPEPRYIYFWNVNTWKPFRAVTSQEVSSEFPPKDFPTLAGDADQEWWAQQASWGLMQVMGAVAREQGFRQPYLTQLTVPEIGLLFGCRVLQSHLKWSKGVVPQALAAYNGGRWQNDKPPYRNAAYAAKVLAQVKS